MYPLSIAQVFFTIKQCFYAEFHSDEDAGLWGQYTWFPYESCCVTLELFELFKPHFPHLLNRNSKNNISLRGLL